MVASKAGVWGEGMIDWEVYEVKEIFYILVGVRIPQTQAFVKMCQICHLKFINSTKCTFYFKEP